MKKILLSLLLIASVNFVYSQTNYPCPIEFRINNGGGNCPDTVISGVTITATGSVTLKLDGPVSPSLIPTLVRVYEDLAVDTLITGITFGPGMLNANGTVTYCYYVGPNNNNNLNGQNRNFRFDIFFNGNPCGPQIGLPVSLKAFSAARSNSAVAIKWTTSTEINNRGFEIQRLIGAGGWQTVGFVASQAAGGNSDGELSYSYNEVNSTSGVSQYRLMQIDIDAKAKFSEIRAVRGIGQLSKTILYPNPTSNGRVSVVFSDASVSRDISVLDMSGRLVKQFRGVTNNNIQIENLNPGMYSIKISIPATGEQTMEKIIVNKR